jgi:MFS family permease
MLADHYGPRWLATAGFVLACPCLVLLRLVDHDSKQQIILFCVLLSFVGLTLTLVLTPLMAEITHIVTDLERDNPGAFGQTGALAQAYGLFVCSFAGGTVVGPLWAGFVTRKVGWATMWWTLGLLSMLTAIPAVLFTGGWLFRRKPRENRHDVETTQADLPTQSTVAV